MASLSDFFPYVLPSVQGCSLPLAEQHIRDACIDFCTHAPVIQLALDPVSAVAGQMEYDIDVPNGTMVHLILEAWYEAQELGRYKSGDTLSGVGQFNPAFAGGGAGSYSGGNSNSASGGNPVSLIQSPGNTFRLNAAPLFDSADAITLLVSIKPTRKAETVSDILLNDYADVIGYGAIARLMRIPGHKFSSPGAFSHEQLYSNARTSARIRAEQSFGRSGSRVKPRRFA